MHISFEIICLLHSFLTCYDYASERVKVITHFMAVIFNGYTNGMSVNSAALFKFFACSSDFRVLFNFCMLLKFFKKKILNLITVSIHSLNKLRHRHQTFSNFYKLFTEAYHTSRHKQQHLCSQIHKAITIQLLHNLTHNYSKFENLYKTLYINLPHQSTSVLTSMLISL